ncbi:hypothetical protein LCGC14_1345300, partial [marine sediment metagenome]
PDPDGALVYRLPPPLRGQRRLRVLVPLRPAFGGGAELDAGLGLHGDPAALRLRISCYPHRGVLHGLYLIVLTAVLRYNA